MSLRSIVFNIILPLAITVIGGVIVYHYSDSARKSPHIVYSIEGPTHFRFVDEIITVNKVRIYNGLDEKADDILVSIDYGFPIGDLQFSNDFLDEVGGTFSISDNKLKASIAIPILRSNEEIVFQTFTLGSIHLVPKFRITSNNHVAQLESKPLINGRFERIEAGVVVLAVAVSALTALLSAATIRYVRSYITLREGGARSANNTGFVLLHLGQVDEALVIFKNFVEKKGGSAYEFSNLALCYALKGDYERADVYLAASRFLIDNVKHPIIDLNQGLIDFVKGRSNQAKESLHSYKEKNRKTYKHYIKFSALLQKAETELKL